MKTLLLCLALLASAATAALAGEPPSAPQLRIETGAHTAAIRRIAADRDGRWIASASVDKTLRLWDGRTGRLLATLRPPIGSGHEGKLYAVAFDPAGDWVAAGGWSGWDWDGAASVYLFDRASGQLRQRLGGLGNVINHLCVSPDGRWLAASLAAGQGVRVWATRTWRPVGEDRDYGAASNGCAFDHAGRLATTSYDGYVRLYAAPEEGGNPQLQRLAKRAAPGGKEPYGIAFSSDGRRLAVGFADSTAVNVLGSEAGDRHGLLHLDTAPDSSGLGNGNLLSVAWSADGRQLLAGGGMYSSGGRYPILAWPRVGEGDGEGGPAQDWPAGNSTLMDLLPLAQGGVAWGAADPALGVNDDTGKPRWRVQPGSGDFRDNWEGFRLNHDATAVDFGLEAWGKRPMRWLGRSGELLTNPLTSPQADESLAGPRLHDAELDIQGWKYTLTPTRQGHAIALNTNERSRALAIDDAGFLLGGSFSLRHFQRDGTERWQQPVPGEAWAVNLSRDGRWAVAAYGDGTIRWHRLRDGAEQLALFVHADGQRWVAWTPSGYYTASPGGEGLIGWHVNRGKDAAADFYPASRFRERFYRPDVVDKVFATQDEAAALAAADAERGRRTQVVEVARVLPPAVRLLAPAEGDRFERPQLTLRYSARTAADAPLTAVKVLVDGRPLEGARGLKPVARAGEYELPVTLPARDLTLSLIAENRHGASEEASVRLTWAGQKVFVAKPRLYVLAVGVADYRDKTLKLNFPAKDARDFAAVLRAQAALYRDVVVKMLPDATVDEVMDGLDWLRKEVTAKDVAVLFLAGHGVNDADGDFYFLPADANTERLRRSAVPYFEIKKTLSSLPGKTLAFIDTCHSGNVMGGQRRGTADMTQIINDLTAAENGVVVFASSTGRQFSLEDPKWGNGAFTKAVVEGLGGKADYTGDGAVSINELDTWIADRVKKLIGNQQTPATTKPQTVQDFPIATVK